MGARVAKKRAATRAAKKRASASPAPEGNTAAESALEPVNKKQVSVVTVESPKRNPTY